LPAPLETRAWQKQDPELAAMYSEHDASGGWSEDDMATLATLRLLWEWADSFAPDYNARPTDKEDDLVIICNYIRRDLPI
jgi:hypothetical protein